MGMQKLTHGHFMSMLYGNLQLVISTGGLETVSVIMESLRKT
jgi:hypothetical protein